MCRSCRSIQFAPGSGHHIQEADRDWPSRRDSYPDKCRQLLSKAIGSHRDMKELQVPGDLISTASNIEAVLKQLPLEKLVVMHTRGEEISQQYRDVSLEHAVVCEIDWAGCCRNLEVLGLFFTESDVHQNRSVASVMLQKLSGATNLQRLGVYLEFDTTGILRCDGLALPHHLTHVDVACHSYNINTECIYTAPSISHLHRLEHLNITGFEFQDFTALSEALGELRFLKIVRLVHQDSGCFEALPIEGERMEVLNASLLRMKSLNRLHLVLRLEFSGLASLCDVLEGRRAPLESLCFVHLEFSVGCIG